MVLPQSLNELGSNNAPKGIIDPKYVRFVGDSVGVVNLTPGALQFLSEQVTEVLQKAVYSAQQYAFHSRRTQLCAEDMEAAFKLQKIKPPLGVNSKRGPQLRPLTMPSGEELFVPDDFDVDVTSEPPAIKLPIEPYIKAHWLAVDGKMAVVPENVPPPKEEDEEDLLPTECDEAKAASISARRETAGGAQGAAVSFRAASKVVETKEQIHIQGPILETLSVEQQLYLKEIVEACVGQDDLRRGSALQSLELDTGLQAVLPRLSRLVYHAIRCNVIHRCLSMLIYVVRLVRSISMNQSARLEGVLHELIPSLMSCMLGRQLCARPETDNHWALRDFAAKTLTQMIKEHGVGDTRMRTLRAVKRVWDDPNSSFPMLYGCLPVLTEFSNTNERQDLLIRVQDLILHTSPRAVAGLSHLEKVEAQKLHGHLNKTESILRKMLPPQ